MTIQTFAKALKSSLNVKAINEYFVDKRDLTLEILQKVRPEGRVEGSRFKLSSVEGGAGASFDYNLTTHFWGDWAKADQNFGLLFFLQKTLKCSAAQAVDWLIENKLLDQKEAKKAISDSEGDPLVIPIPEEELGWEKVSSAQILKKDKGIIKDHWEYRDTDGSVIGYKYRVDDRRTKKEVYTLTYRAQSGWLRKAWQKKLIPPYGLEKLGSGPNIRVLFVEGEKAADKAQEILGERWKVLSFSGLSASDQLWIPPGEFWSSVEVLIWPDNDSAGREAARRIQIKLQSLRHPPREIRIVRADKIPSLPPKWDLGDWDEDCGVDVNYELENAEEVGSFENISQEWVYVSQQDSFYNLEDRSLIWSVTSFDRTYARFAERGTPPSKKFLSDLTTLKTDDLDFVPGGPSIILSPTGKQFLNEWYPTEVYSKAIDIASDPSITDEEIAENAKFFIQHLNRVCEDEIVEPDRDAKTGEIKESTLDRTLADALAYHFSEIVKRPMDKRGWIPMLLSEANGTGKTYFRRAMAAVLGPNRARTVTVSEFIGDYHDWQDGILFYELGETKSHSDTEVYEALKKLHSYLPFNDSMLKSRLQNTQQLNIKSKAKKLQRDFLNGYITSNDLYPLALANNAGQETSDRRLLVIRCERILNEQETIELFDEELVERPEWIGAWLMRYKPKFKWNPSWAPITEHKRKMFEKDKERAETRTEKYELGRYTEFYHFLNYAREQKLGCLSREVFTRPQLKSIIEANHIKFPYDKAKMEGLLNRAGIYRGPKIQIDGVQEQMYVFGKELVNADPALIKKKLKENIDDIM